MRSTRKTRNNVRASLTRSEMMARVRSKGTRPEVAVLSIIRAARFQVSQHVRSLPGTPDFLLPRRRLAIFVHGCFWHAHSCRRGRSMPAVRRAFWQAKKAANRARDRRSTAALRRLGYRVLVLWECQLKDEAK